MKIFFFLKKFYFFLKWMAFEQDTYNLLRLIFIFAPWGIVEIFRLSNGY